MLTESPAPSDELAAELELELINDELKLELDATLLTGALEMALDKELAELTGAGVLLEEELTGAGALLGALLEELTGAGALLEEELTDASALLEDVSFPGPPQAESARVRKPADISLANGAVFNENCSRPMCISLRLF